MCFCGKWQQQKQTAWQYNKSCSFEERAMFDVTEEENKPIAAAHSTLFSRAQVSII